MPDLPPLLQLDPDRVYAVEYLLAEGNERPMSRWGHGMLRLVICAPGRVRGPDCRSTCSITRCCRFARSWVTCRSPAGAG